MSTDRIADVPPSPVGHVPSSAAILTPVIRRAGGRALGIHGVHKNVKHVSAAFHGSAPRENE